MKPPSDIPECLLLSFFREHDEKFFKKCCSIRVKECSSLPLSIICERIAVPICAAVIGFRCGDAVAEHLDNVPAGHFHRHIGGTLSTHSRVVKPILVMVAVSSLMVKPCAGISEDAALAIVRTLRTGVISRTHEKFGGTVFGKVVYQALAVKTDAEAIPADLQTVLCDGTKMTFGFFKSDWRLFHFIPLRRVLCGTRRRNARKDFLLYRDTGAGGINVSLNVAY